MSKPTLLKSTIARLLKQIEIERQKEKPYGEMFDQAPVLKHFICYVNKRMNSAALSANKRLKKKLGIKRNNDEILQFLRAVPVLKPYLERYIILTEKNENLSVDKACWLLANHLRELLVKKDPSLLNRLSAPVGCVVRERKCIVHGDLCVRWNENGFDFFGKEFKRVKK